MRPLLGEEKNVQKVEDAFEFPDTNDRKEVKVIGTKSKALDGKDKAGKRWDFTFDKVFDPNSSQAQVFEEISQLVQSSLDGYQTCIFSYGQTGSGKVL